MGSRIGFAIATALMASGIIQIVPIRMVLGGIPRNTSLTD